MNRRSFILAGSTVLSGCVGLSGSRSSTSTPDDTADTTPSTATDQTTTISELKVGLEPIVSEVSLPVAYEHVLNNELQFLATKTGQVYVRENGTLRDEPILDLSEKLVAIESWEQGLVGFTAHPSFETNRRIYVRYSGSPHEGTPDDYSHTFVLAEFEVSSDLSRIDPRSERRVLEIPEPGPVHNGGALEFGPDGYLYVGVGDGGGGQFDNGPGHEEDWYDAVPGGNGQDITENLLGSILRIDVDVQDGDRPYGIPSDNPLVGTSGLDEQYAWGLRNPYQMSWTDGKLIAGDVGQDSFEELNIIKRGKNYGWNVREGPDCLTPGSATSQITSCPQTTPEGDPLVDPVAGYAHRETKSRTTAVIAGYVYTGSALPVLNDLYVFGDLMREGRGHIFAADPTETEGGLWKTTELSVTSPDGKPLSDAVISLGQDQDGELYVSTYDFQNNTGGISKLVPAE